MGWISVKDELPNYRENVIVFTESILTLGIWQEEDMARCGGKGIPLMYGRTMKF